MSSILNLHEWNPKQSSLISNRSGCVLHHLPKVSGLLYLPNINVNRGRIFDNSRRSASPFGCFVFTHSSRFYSCKTMSTVTTSSSVYRAFFHIRQHSEGDKRNAKSSRSVWVCLTSISSGVLRQGSMGPKTVHMQMSIRRTNLQVPDE